MKNRPYVGEGPIPKGKLRMNWTTETVGLQERKIAYACEGTHYTHEGLYPLEDVLMQVSDVALEANVPKTLPDLILIGSDLEGNSCIINSPYARTVISCKDPVVKKMTENGLNGLACELDIIEVLNPETEMEVAKLFYDPRYGEWLIGKFSISTEEYYALVAQLRENGIINCGGHSHHKGRVFKAAYAAARMIIRG